MLEPIIFNRYRRAIRAAANLIFGSLIIADVIAVPLLITNPSFESDPAPVPSAINTGVPSGWSSYNPNNTPGVFYGSLYAAPDNYPAGAPDGNHVQVNYIAAGNASGEEFGVLQSLSATLQANTIYTLTVEVGNIASGSNDLNATPDNPDDDPFFNINGFNGYRVELRTDSSIGSGTTLAAETGSVGGDNVIADGAFNTVTIVFDSRQAAADLIGQPLEILLVNLNEVDPAFPGHDRETNFDNVRLDAAEVETHVVAVPLPGPWLILLTFVIFAAGRFQLSDYKENKYNE